MPEGMGIILRTAGASRTKPEIKRDFEYLIRMWETVRDMTLKSQAPTLVYEEGSLIKRSLRDLYNKEIDEIMVAGEAGYREAHDFMKMLMPSNVRAVKQYRDGQPLFSRMGVESQLDAMFSPTVQLRSGGYIVINQTEALVSIDVNSGRATREHHIEDTALKTNLEAAEEVARQLRLRDLAGLIVIDFIDMDEKRNNRAVERKLSDCLRQDRARIQVGRISHFGLLEMSRQRIRASVLESSTEPCPQCGGTGHVRSVSSVALQLLRGLEEILMKGATHNLVVAHPHRRRALRAQSQARPSARPRKQLQGDAGRDRRSDRERTAILRHRPRRAGAYAGSRQGAAGGAGGRRPPLAGRSLFDDEELFDVELESEVETEETEGLVRRRGGAAMARAAKVRAASGAGAGAAAAESTRRRRAARGRLACSADAGALPEAPLGRRRSRRGREAEEQPGGVRADQAARRRTAAAASRTSRRPPPAWRPEDGLAGSISDELGAASAASEAVDCGRRFRRVFVRPTPTLARSSARADCDRAGTAAARSSRIARWRPASRPNAERGVRQGRARRSTVREKVELLAESRRPTPSPADVATPNAGLPCAGRRPADRAGRRGLAAARRMVVATLRQRRIAPLRSQE